MFLGRVVPCTRVLRIVCKPGECGPLKTLICPPGVHSPWLSARLLDRTFRSSACSLCEGQMASGVSKPKNEHRNRLAKEKSPYLLQHASNPVDWYPWGEEAFSKARTEDKLIFLSVGYSTCHWCHVMERESFEDESIAAIMNEYFVNVKVDREERPDVDKIYMTFIQASSGSGGWPMSVFLTPDLKPVAGGTYYPPLDNYGRPGFKTVLLNMAKQWSEKRAKISATGTRITELLRKTTAFDVGLAGSLIGGEVPGKESWELCMTQLSETYDPVFGGFSRAPKFPQPGNLFFLFHLISRDPTSESALEAKKMVLHTLDMMAKGGIHDHIAQGFARYSTDSKWHVPHFEKMLYDQGQLTVAYTDAFLLTRDEKYAEIVRDILTYVSRDLSHPEGGFYSAEDADSLPTPTGLKKKEGAFCVWTYKEIKELLDRPLASKPDVKLYTVFCHHFGVRDGGNVGPDQDPHHELSGQNVLAIFGTELDTCEKYDLTVEEFHKEMDLAKKILYDARTKRPRPHLDDKIITSWNGLMISGFAKAACALDDDKYLNRALEAANFIKTHLYTENKRLLRSCYTKDGKVVQIDKPIEGFLDDYACLIRGLLDLYEASLNPDWLMWANVLQTTQDELFWDHGLAGYYSTSSGDNYALFRLKEDQDGAEPSGNSVAACNLLRLSTMLDNPDYHEKAGRLLSSFTSRLSRVPIALPEMTSALMLFHDAPTQVVVTGSMSNADTASLVKVVRKGLVPGLVLMATDGNPDSFLCRHNQAVRKMKKLGESQAAYVCRGRACSLPVTTPTDLAALLEL